MKTSHCRTHSPTYNHAHTPHARNHARKHKESIKFFSNMTFNNNNNTLLLSLYPEELESEAQQNSINKHNHEQGRGQK